MSPRRGGEADKLGNQYEAAWTIMHLLFVLQGRGDSLRVEDTGDLAEGSEFTYRDARSTQVHQLKRQNGLVNNWSVKSLAALDVWVNAKRHVAGGRQYHFVSTVPARTLHELAVKSRQSGDLARYISDWLSTNEKLPPVFDELAARDVLGDPATAYQTLRGMYLSVYGEQEINSVNEVLAETLLEGAGNGKAMAASLANLIVNNLGVLLERELILEKLTEYDIRRADVAALPGLVEQVNAATSSWLDSVERQLVQPVLVRAEADELAKLALAEGKLTLVTGSAGVGKSGVLHQAVSKLRSDGVATLCFRIDRLEPFSSTSELGAQLGLGRSPVATLAAAAGDAPSVLVIDQLDAVSFASGRMPNSLDPVADLVREAGAFPSMRVMWACRQFDVDNDERIRSLIKHQAAKTLKVDLLTDVQVRDAIAAMGIDAAILRVEQRALLRTPFNLSLLSAVADDAGALNFDGTNRLLEMYWDRKRRNARQRRAGTKFDRVVKVVAEAMSRRQTLSVPSALRDDDDLADDADVLVSEHILTRDGARIAFAHEAMFDYAFARSWAVRDVSVVKFFEDDAQELFRRGQLRQILAYLRSTEPPRFVVELETLLTSDKIRFHLKDVALGILGGLPDPSAEEAAAVLRVADVAGFAKRIWRHLNTPAWFSRFDAGGLIEQWLNSEADRKARAVDLMSRAVHVQATRVAELLDRDGSDPDIIRQIFRFADLGDDDSLFELLLTAVRQGIFAGREDWLWVSVHDLPKRAPDLAITLLHTFLEQQEDVLELTGDGKVAILTGRDHTAVEFVRECAELSPRKYCEVVIPYLIRVMRLTQRDHQGPGYPSDGHFLWREPEEHLAHELDAALMLGAVRALETVGGSNPEAATVFLDDLAAVELDSAQYLLYVGLIATGAYNAERSAFHLLGGVDRLFCGYRSSSVWMTRRLLQAICSSIEASHFAQLETMVCDLRFTWEGRNAGWYAFTLLSGLDEAKLSEVGRRRLGEYRRKFNRQQPPEPEGVIAGFVGSPIAPGAARQMSDKHWLSAIRKHSVERLRGMPFTGGARELSHVLREQVKEQPRRFAALCLSFNETTHSAYGDAVLMGLGDAEAQQDPEPIFRAVRHIASLRKDAHDRWLGWALRPHLQSAPIDIVELVRDHALVATDPAEEGLLFKSGQDTLGRSSDLEMTAMNTARGSLIESLGDLLIFDADGSRTAAVVPVLERLAADPNVAVRVSSAHLVAAVVRYNRPAALRAVPILLDADDLLLTASTTRRLMNCVGNQDPERVVPLIDRMLASQQQQVRRVGGQLAAFAALEWDVSDRLERAVAAEDPWTRQGAAETCAQQVRQTSDVMTAKQVLESLAFDESKEIRDAVATVVPALRGEALRPFADTLRILLESPAFEAAMPQILFTLKYAPDRVDDLIVLCASRFVTVSGADSSDIRTGAAGDASQVGKLVIRALAQCKDSEQRSRLLDILDGLLLVGSYGIENLVTQSERGEVVDDL